MRVVDVAAFNKQGRPAQRSRMGRISKTEDCLPGVCLR
jgi:hypothetical protein